MSIYEAAKQALEALENHTHESQRIGRIAVAINALRAAIAPATCNRMPAFEGPLSAMQRLTDVQQEMESTSRESRQVETVAYVTGYSKGYATVRPVDPCLLMPVGMALYRSPTINKMETVEPVAWMHEFEGVATINMTPPNYYGDHWKHTALYTAPPETVARAVDAERERIAAWVEDMCAGLDAKTIANGIRNGGNDDIRAFEVRK